MKHPIPIYVAVEDELSEWVVRRLLTLRTIPYAVGAVFGRSGAGYLKKRAAAFNNAAKHCPFFLLADLDQSPCVPALLDEWLDNPRHKHFLLRIAVHEVESWLLGDLIGLVEFLGCRPPIRAFVPESLADAKRTLLDLALSSRNRRIREAVVWRDDASGRLLQGPDYNGTLGRFVMESWNVAEARKSCRSLERAFRALEKLEADF